MKISKIFHWLYAFLMSLPIVAVFTTSLYVVFNPNAMESTSITETQYRKVEYQTNEVNTIDDLIIGNVYQFFSISPSPYELGWEDLFQQTTEDIDIEVLSFSTCYYETYYYDELYFEGNYQYLKSDFVMSLTMPYFTGIYWTFYSTDESYFCTQFDDIRFNYIIIMNNNLKQYIIDNYSSDFDNYYESALAFFDIADLTKVPYQYEEIETTTLDNAFSWAVNSINDNPLFSWASASFLVQPFHYIGNVFGLPMTSPINTLLSYWLDISIIWLVFDLIMYLPLLAHRWLDKGVLE